MFTPHPKFQTLNTSELIKYFNELYSKLSIRHSEYNVFDNFLDCCINGFSFNYDRNIMDRIVKEYTQDERYIFGEMLRIWVQCVNLNVTDNNSFYDFFGTIYENNAMTKTKGFAQYFTPEPLCKLLASITIDENKVGETINEPACGSGRLNLAAHSVNYKMIHVANDLDITCVKMATLNFMIHGVKGIVTCDDGLWPKDKFKCAFIINYHTAPLIEYVNDVNQAYNFISTLKGKTIENSIQEEIISTPQAETPRNVAQKVNVQLDLFSM